MSTASALPDRNRVQAAEGLRRRTTARCTATASCGSPPRPTRSCRCAIRACSRTRPICPVIVLARVISRLGSLPDINTSVIEGLYASDLAYLQRLYETFNAAASDVRTRRSARPMAPRPACRGWPRWGKHEGLSREAAVRGDGLHRAPLPLVARRADASSSTASAAAGAGRSRRSTARLDGAPPNPFDV